MNIKKYTLCTQSKHGFSALELLLVLALIGLLLLTGNGLLSAINNQQAANILAKAVFVYSSTANRFIHNHYQELYINLQNNHLNTITWSQIQAEEGKEEEGNSPTITPPLNQITVAPCIQVNLFGNTLNAYLFFVANNTAIQSVTHNVNLSHTYSNASSMRTITNHLLDLDAMQINSAMLRLGGYAGYIHNDSIAYGVHNGWQVSANTLQQSLNNCDGSAIIKHSPVINLTMLTVLPNTLGDFTALDRTADNFNDAGSESNSNTIGTTIDLATIESSAITDQPHRLVFNLSEESMVGLQAANSYQDKNFLTNGNNLLVVRSTAIDYANHKQELPQDLKQGSFSADTITATKYVNVQDPCDNKEIGAFARINQASYTFDNILLGQAQCTRNSLFCQTANATGNTPCYLPINSLTVRVNTSGAVIDCEQLVGRGFFIVAGSEEYGQSPQPSAFPGMCCAWDGSPKRYSSNSQDSPDAWQKTLRDNLHGVSVVLAAKYMAYFENHANTNLWCPIPACAIWPGSKWSNANVTSVVCSNDTSNLNYLMAP